MAESRHERIRYQCPRCGAHTIARADTDSVRCTVCGNTDLKPLADVPPSSRILGDDDEPRDGD